MLKLFFADWLLSISIESELQQDLLALVSSMLVRTNQSVETQVRSSFLPRPACFF